MDSAYRRVRVTRANGLRTPELSLSRCHCQESLDTSYRNVVWKLVAAESRKRKEMESPRTVPRPVPAGGKAAAAVLSIYTQA